MLFAWQASFAEHPQWHKDSGRPKLDGYPGLLERHNSCDFSSRLLRLWLLFRLLLLAFFAVARPLLAMLEKVLRIHTEDCQACRIGDVHRIVQHVTVKIGIASVQQDR